MQLDQTEDDYCWWRSLDLDGRPFFMQQRRDQAKNCMPINVRSRIPIGNLKGLTEYDGGMIREARLNERQRDDSWRSSIRTNVSHDVEVRTDTITVSDDMEVDDPNLDLEGEQQNITPADVEEYVPLTVVGEDVMPLAESQSGVRENVQAIEVVREAYRDVARRPVKDIHPPSPTTQRTNTNVLAMVPKNYKFERRIEDLHANLNSSFIDLIVYYPPRPCLFNERNEPRPVIPYSQLGPLDAESYVKFSEADYHGIDRRTIVDRAQLDVAYCVPINWDNLLKWGRYLGHLPVVMNDVVYKLMSGYSTRLHALAKELRQRFCYRDSDAFCMSDLLQPDEVVWYNPQQYQALGLCDRERLSNLLIEMKRKLAEDTGVVNVDNALHLSKFSADQSGRFVRFANSYYIQ